MNRIGLAGEVLRGWKTTHEAVVVVAAADVAVVVLAAGANRFFRASAASRSFSRLSD